MRIILLGLWYLLYPCEKKKIESKNGLIKGGMKNLKNDFEIIKKE